MYVIKLEDADRNSKNVGNKAAALGELMNAGFPVPPGFVITSEGFEKFLRSARIGNRIAEIVTGLSYKDYSELKQAYEDIRKLITEAEFPEAMEKEIKEAYEEISIGKEAKELGGIALDLIKAGRTEVRVAVRPSLRSEELPYANFENQFSPSLNVRGARNVLEAVKECWASAFSPRAMLYRKSRRITKVPVMGIVVQKMLDPQKSGFAFTSQPETRERSRIVIEAAWGIGEAITSGIVTPDEYVIDRESGNIVSRVVRKKEWMKRKDELTGALAKEPVPRENSGLQVLSEAEIRKIVGMALRAERHFNNHPQDIEWAIERNRVFFIHARPLSSFGTYIPEDEENGEVVARGIPAFLGKAKGRAKIVNSPGDLHMIEKGDVAVMSMTYPDVVPYMEKLSALVAEEGGRMSHAAVISREFGVPCIVAAENATSLIREGQEVVVDASRGQVLRIPLAESAESIQSIGIPASSGFEEHREDASVPPAGIATEVGMVLSSPGAGSETAGKSDFIVILRPEMLFPELSQNPFFLATNEPERLSSLIAERLGGLARMVYPKRVYYKGLDIRTDEMDYSEGMEEEPEEGNPIIGWHGIRRAIGNPEILMCETGALRRLREQGLDNVFYAIPFVSSPEEIGTFKSMTGMSDFGVAIETPAAAIEAEEVCRQGAKFVLINYDVLGQLVLAADRDNPKVSRIYSERSRPVISLIKHAVRACRKNGVKTIVCGDAAGDRNSVEALINVGVDALCSEPESIDALKSLVSVTEKKLLLERMRRE